MAAPGSFDKWRYTLYTTLVVLILFNSWTFKLVNSILSGFIGSICDREGCPTMLGLFIHAIVFTIIVRYMMDLHL